MEDEIRLEEFKRRNDGDRMWFVKYWAEYVRTHPDRVWSRQQNVLINSMMQNARQLKMTPGEYLEMKGEGHLCSRK